MNLVCFASALNSRFSVRVSLPRYITGGIKVYRDLKQTLW